PVPALTAQVVENTSALARIDPPAPRPVTPLAPGRFGWQLTVSQETQDLKQEVQDLLGSDVPAGDLEAVLKYSLLAAKEKLLKRKCAATEHPRPGRPRSADSRSIPAEVKRAVWERDGGQCTFTSDTGHRCTERRDVQFDHIEPYARDGASSVSNIRLLCRAHNQYEAERTYGAEFMRHKRKRLASLG
ncbi:MAG TPA: HNH endonuclease, partial [Candidatus Eisenbacteria bacterium]|nr:HNH endonuclease [Candidatus Eisenbacteria bacterium]